MHTWPGNSHQRMIFSSRSVRGCFPRIQWAVVGWLLLFLVHSAPGILPPPRTGNLYVTSFGTDSVAVYDSTGAYLRSFSAPGLDGPRGIVFAPNNRIYIAGQHSDQIFVFDRNEQLITTFGHMQLDGPTGMAVEDTLLYVCSFNNDQVVVFNLEGTFLRTFTGGGLNGPNCVAFDSHGNIYVSSAMTATVVKFAPDETHRITFTGGGLSSPMGIARDTADVLYVAGGGSNNIVMFDTLGNTLGTITHADLGGPQGIAFDDRGHFFTSSFFQDHLVEFDGSGNYVQTITAGNLDMPRSLAFEPLEPPTGLGQPVGIPHAVELYPNFPNPFNPATHFRFRIADVGFVKLKIYDVMGRPVKTLVQEKLSPGRYEVQWDGTDDAGRAVASGIYLYRLQAGERVLTRKMVLIK